MICPNNCTLQFTVFFLIFKRELTDDLFWFGRIFCCCLDCNPAPSPKLGSESVPASSFCQEFCSCNIAKTRIDPARFVLSYDISRSTKFCTHGIAQHSGFLCPLEIPGRFSNGILHKQYFIRTLALLQSQQMNIFLFILSKPHMIFCLIFHIQSFKFAEQAASGRQI